MCRGCIHGKFTKVTFPRSGNRASGVLQLVHSNICGLMSTRYLRGNEYFVTFIDEFSRKTWIYFFEDKGQGLHSLPRVQGACGEYDMKKDEDTSYG